MIKLGGAYFDEASIVAIEPCDTHGAEGPAMSYLVHIIGGGFYQWTADAAEVQRRLEEVGLIAPQHSLMPDFTVSELAELGACLADGYNYVAKDEDGRIYAFSEAPIKGRQSWLNDDSVSRVAGLTAGEYAMLSFKDEFPLDIAVALEGMLR